jgi:uncharacterized protein YbaA (DUF1428 family)
MAKYVDGFVLTVPKKNMPTYKKMALEGGGVWKKFGALDFKECVIDDEKPSGVVRTFRKLTGAKPSEAILFSFITQTTQRQSPLNNNRQQRRRCRHRQAASLRPLPAVLPLLPPR